MYIYASSVITFIALIYYTVLLFIILGQKINNRVRIFFGLYLFSMMVWSFAAFMIFSGLTTNTLFWNRVLVVGSEGMPVAFFGFVASFLMLDRRRWLIVAYISYFLTELTNVTGLLITSAYLDPVNGRLMNEYGIGVVLGSILWAFFIGFAAADLFVAYRNSKDYLFKNRIKYLMLVIVVIFAGNLTNLTGFKYYPGDVAFNIISAFLITIAILRHRLLDFSVVLRKGLLYTVPTALIGLSYYVVMLIALRIQSVSGPQILLLSLLVALVSALIIQPLRNQLQTWIDRFFFKEKHDASLMLQRISRTTAYVLDIDEITRMIMDEITHTLHVDQAAFFLKRPESGEFYLSSFRGLEHKFDIHWKGDHPIVQSLASFDQPLTRHDMNVMPQFRALQGVDRDALEKIWAELLIPLKVKGELVGIFSIGPKKSKDVYTDEDQLNLMTLANQMAVAVKNAHLYSAEQSRREELDTLYHLSRQLVAIDEVDEILKVTIRHLVKSIPVTFARILLLNEAGDYVCRVAFPIRTLEHSLEEGRIEPEISKPVFTKAINQSDPMVIYRDDPTLSAEERTALLLDQVSSSCLAPLRVGEKAIGLFFIGERRGVNRESFGEDKLRLISSIADQAASALQRANLHEQMEDSFLETVLALANAMDARDTYTINHSQRLAEMAEKICIALGRPEEEIKAIHWAALLHDLGKIGVPDEILRKPGSLTEEEWAMMRKHPEDGARIVAPVKKLANVSPIIHAHHEHYDGTGYPDGLKGDQIPFGARLITIVDAYGAMTDDRVYRKTRNSSDAINELIRCKGTHFDPELVDRFVEIIQKDLLVEVG
jgi:putative nucleotidyltransferase with HDIG domain